MSRPIRVSVKTHVTCSLQRAFKTPLLCDLSKIHTGYGVMPRVTHCTDDENWGLPGSTKKIMVAQSFTQNGGFAMVEKIVDRVENTYWKFELSEFQFWVVGFSKFTGEWQTTELGKNNILINYTYTLHGGQPILYPLQWLFAKLIWRPYMKRVLKNIRLLISNQEPFKYTDKPD